ncbi:MAG: hypothetical protein KTR32_42660 [Granulosicoccus sp.]|nr:hypothetical protein [Granulosicoccus sp.]
MRLLLFIIFLVVSPLATGHGDIDNEISLALSDETITVVAGATIHIPVLDERLIRQYNPNRLSIEIKTVPSHGNVLIDSGAKRLVYHHAGQSTVSDSFTYQFFYHDQPVSNEVIITLEITEG